MQVILGFYIAIIGIQLLYYFGIFSAFIFDNQKNSDVSEDIPVSIIISAKNEAENLIKNLPFFRNQKQRNFEIILINDHSSDDTLKIMEDFKQKNPNISITVLNLQQNNTGNKKAALTKGIEIAKYPNLLFTDADCKPSSEFWISMMTSKLKNKKIVLGYGAYQKTDTWLNRIIRFETVITALQYFSYAKIGIPYMGVGRNLAYKRELFIQNNGFQTHKHIKSGDDDLFINEVATKNNTTICYQKEAHTISKPHTDFFKWLHQKKRHISTAESYKPVHQLLLGLFYISNVLFWILSIYLLVILKSTTFIIFLFFIRIGIQYFYLAKANNKLNEKDLIIFTPILELFLLFIQVYLFISNLMVKPKHW